MKVRERQASRALLVTPDAELLLMKVHLPWRSEDLWITPGGGVRRSESGPEALRREVREETGLVLLEAGPQVWQREHLWDHLDPPLLQRERFYLLRSQRFEPRTDGLREGGEREWFLEYHWWPIDELPECDPGFAPTRLGELLRHLLRTGPPPEPIRIGT